MILFVIIAIAGVGMVFVSYSKTKKCTEVTTGVIYDVEYRITREDGRVERVSELNVDSNFYKNKPKISAFPTYQYTVDGKTYTQRVSKSYSVYIPRKGQEVKIHYNSENPEQYYAPGDLGQFLTGAVFGIVGVIGIICSLIGMLIS